MSGLICLNWYDWNAFNSAALWIILPEVGIDLPELIRLKLMVHHIIRFQLKLGRDWSAWIDTIETRDSGLQFTIVCMVGIDLPELIRLKQMFNKMSPKVKQMSGLICLNWYDWNYTGFNYTSIRLCSRDWSAWIDTIETWRILLTLFHSLRRSGLICLNWYDWNSRIKEETTAISL